jgi:hypothetical protein
MKILTIAVTSSVACALVACSSSDRPLAPLAHGEKTSQIAQALAAPAAPATECTPGWTQVASPNIGMSDNVLGGVAGSGPDDVWAVGDYAQDSNPDFNITLIQHFDGHAWSVVPSPNVGDQANQLYSVTTAAPTKAWTTGYFLDPAHSPRGLIEAWDGHAWGVVDHPHTGAADWLYSVFAVGPSDVWAVGNSRDEDGVFHTLIEHFDGVKWSIVPSPDPGSNGNLLYGVTARGADDVWAVGQRVDDDNPDEALIEHFDGTAWSVVGSEPRGDSMVLLIGVSGSPGASPRAVGESASNVTGQARRTVAQRDLQGDWDFETSANAGTAVDDNYLYSLTSTPDATNWAVGTFLDQITDNNFTLIERLTPAGWVAVPSPKPLDGRQQHSRRGDAHRAARRLGGGHLRRRQRTRDAHPAQLRIAFRASKAHRLAASGTWRQSSSSIKT